MPPITGWAMENKQADLNTPSKPGRLQPIAELSLHPFVRATEIEDCSLYWMPVDSFPMNNMQRTWLLTFHQRLALHLQQKYKLREEVFLHFKCIYPDLVSRFGETSLDFVPMMGAAITPGTSQPKPIDMQSLKEQVGQASKNGTLLNTQQWMPDLLYWFSGKKPVEQKQAFYGQGGMMSLFLAPDPETAPPDIYLPLLVRTSPGFIGSGAEKMQSEVARAYSLRDAFLNKSKEVFGAPLREQASYKGMLFILPFFTAATLTSVSAELRKVWFDVFEGYFIESPVDEGVLLMLKKPDFDEELGLLMEKMREDGHVYRGE